MAEFLISLSDAFDDFDTELLKIRKSLKHIPSGDLLDQYKERTFGFSQLLSNRDEAGLRALEIPIVIFGDFDFIQIWNSSDISDEIRDTIWNYILHFQVYSGRNIVSTEKSTENDKTQVANGLRNVLEDQNVLESNVKAIENASIDPETGKANEFGQILNELTTQMTENFRNNPEELLSGSGIMSLMQNIATTLKDKQESGEIDMEKMAEQAQSMISGLNLGGMEKVLNGAQDGIGDLNGLMGSLGGSGAGNLGSVGNIVGAVSGLMGEEAEEDKTPEDFKPYKSEVPTEFLDKLREERDLERKKKKSSGKSKKSKGRKRK